MQPSPNTQILGPSKRYPNFHFSMIFIFLFMISYCILGIWLLFDGWINKFSSLYWLWSISTQTGLPTIYSLALMSLVGSILGCGTLDIVSFHKYVAIEKCYDLDHIWGYLISPVLAAIVGLLVFALFQSGLLIFSGGFNNQPAPGTASLGFTAVGFVAGYSWHDAVVKFQEISKRIFEGKNTNNQNTQNNEQPVPPAIPNESDPNTQNDEQPVPPAIPNESDPNTQNDEQPVPPAISNESDPNTQNDEQPVPPATLKELEAENARLKKLLVETMLENEITKEALLKK